MGNKNLMICKDFDKCKRVGCDHKREHKFYEDECNLKCDGTTVPCVSARKIKLKKLKVK